MNLYYLYGILNSQDQEQGISSEGLCADFDLVSEKEFGQAAIEKNLKDIAWVNEKVLQHQNRLSSLAAKHNVIPLKFGSIFKSEEAVKSMLSRRKEEFSLLLRRFEGKREWGLKLFYEESITKQRQIDHSSDLQAIDQQINSANDGSAFLLKKKREELLKRLVKQALNEVRTEIYETITSITPDTKVQKELDKKLTGRDDINLLNLSMLASSSESDLLKSQLSDLADSLKQDGIIAELSGPWPPYSFVENG
ncbi:MAG: GvpL/GvpF family gas vesicle protein [Bacteroidota bacterium]